MSKPLGLTPDFRVTHPTGAEDAIWRAVEEVIAANMSPEQFRREAAQAWEYVLKEQADGARKVLTL